MKTEILAICSHPDILQTIVRLINNNPQWNGTGALSEEEATSLLSKQSFDVVLLGAGMDPSSENCLMAVSPGVRFIQHYGGGSGLLTAEIYEALRPLPNPPRGGGLQNMCKS